MASALTTSSLHLSKTHKSTHHQSKTSPKKALSNRFRTQAVQETKEKSKPTIRSSPDEITKKFGLEVGLWKIFSSKSEEGDGQVKSKTDEAKGLLAKYGGAYLATSITLSLISFTLCYALVRAGIDVQALLTKVGIATDEIGGKVGTFALAYAAHKAASPISLFGSHRASILSGCSNSKELQWIDLSASVSSRMIAAPKSFTRRIFVINAESKSEVLLVGNQAGF